MRDVKQEYQKMQESLLPDPEKREEMWERIVKESAQNKKQRRRDYLKAGLISSTAAALLLCVLFVPQIGLADHINELIQSVFVKGTDNVTKEVQKDLYSDEDQHVKMQIREMLSDGSCVYLGIHYQALDREGREFLVNSKWFGGNGVTGDKPFCLSSQEYLKHGTGCTFNLEEIEEMRTDDERYYTYYFFESDDRFSFEDGELPFQYSMSEVPGHLKEGKIDIKSNLDRVLYRLEKKGAGSKEASPIYLSVSKLSFLLLMPGADSLKGENENADDEPKELKVVFTTKDGLERYDISTVDVPEKNSRMMKLLDGQKNKQEYRLLGGTFQEDNHKKLIASPEATLDHPDQIAAIEIAGESYELIREE